MFVNNVQIVTAKDGALAKKTQERREKLRQALVEVAERRIAANGCTALTARDVAGEAGCAVGAIYNIFSDMDAMVAAVNSRTVARLEAAVAAAFARDPSSTQPKRALTLLGQTYFEFVMANPQLWSAIFELGFRASKDLPQWQVAEHVHLLGHIVKPLRMLFSAVHGIVSLGQQRRFMAVPPAEIAAQITFIVEAFCDGVVARKG
jgi:AcrR family transcriptional regulator